MSWKRVQLSEVLIQQKETVELKPSEEYTLVTISKTGAITKRETKKGVEIKGKSALKIKSGDFIYSRLAVHSGAFGIIPKELNDAIVTNEMPSFAMKENILPEFLIHSLTLPDFNHQITHLTKGVGRTRVKEKSFLGLEINLPILSEQKQIVAWLESCLKISEDISANQIAQLDLVKQLRQAFFREAMQGKLVPQDANDEPASVLLEKIIAEKERLIKDKKIKKQKPLVPITEEEIPFKIPENWIWLKFGNVAEMSRGRFSARPRNDPQFYKGEYPFLQIGSLDDHGSLILDAPQSLNEKGLKVSKKFPKSTVVIAIVGGTIANLGVLGKEMCFPDSLIGFYPFEKMYHQDYLLYFLRFSQPILRNAAYQMSGQPNIKLPNLQELAFPMPPLSEQKRIVEKLNKLMAYCNDLEVSIKESQQQNEMLLQQVLREALEPNEEEII